MPGSPTRSASVADNMRVTTSAGPPGGNGTIQRIGFDGHAAAVCACATLATNIVAAATNAAVRYLAFISPLPASDLRGLDGNGQIAEPGSSAEVEAVAGVRRRGQPAAQK